MSPLDFAKVNGCEVCNGSSTDICCFNYIICIFESHTNGRVLSIEDLFRVNTQARYRRGE